MTEEQIIQFVTDMEEFFGSLPSPEHEPIRFAHYIKLYRYYKGLS
jgi:hypothetical protein